MINQIFNEDCLIGMQRIPDKSVDIILCDLPYGTTACAWDTIIPFDKLWEQYKRVIKDNGAIVLTASQPFTSQVVSSNIEMFRHSWIWDKKKSANAMLSEIQPLKVHEDILIFSKKKANYYPIKIKGKPRADKKASIPNGDNFGSKVVERQYSNSEGLYYPKSILEVSGADQTDKFHPTQKPVPLFEYLIKTYTNENETVLDNCIGSGTTAIACINTKRNYIGFEMDEEYFKLASARIDKHTKEFNCEVGLFAPEIQGSLF